MSQQLIARLREIYSGETGDVWRRLERETPSTYWEENAVLGRRDTYADLIGSLQPLAGRRVLDAGCGRGLLARRLARQGATVLGVDVIEDHVLEARRAENGEQPSFAVADFRDLLSSEPPFDEIVIQEVLEDYPADERLDTIRRFAESRAGRIHVIFRQPGRWGGLVGPLLPDALVPTIDPVDLLRSVHLYTPYRLTHQETIRRRSYNVQRVELRLRVE